MHTLVNEARRHLGNHVRGGNKETRKTEVGRIKKFLDWVEENERVTSIKDIGKRHVIAFWNGHRGLADSTLHKYWLVLCLLWGWFGKPGKPPEPYRKHALQPGNVGGQESHAYVAGIQEATRIARQSMGISLCKLANMTGIEVRHLEALESGDLSVVTTEQVAALFTALKIKHVIGIDKLSK